MNGILTSEDKSAENCLEIIAQTPKMEGLNLSKVVSTKQKYLWQKPTETDFDRRTIHSNNLNTVSYTHLTLPTKRIV